LSAGSARRLATVGALAAALALGGCAAPQSAALRAPAGTPLAAIVEALPRNLTGKVLKTELRARFG